MEQNRVIIFDTTLRDGEQTPGVSLNLTEKVEIAKRLEKLGADVIEAGFPATSIGDFEAVRAVSAAVDCSVCGLSRCVESDIRTCWDALKGGKTPRIHLFIATSDIHMEYKLKMKPDEVVRRAVESVSLAKSFTDNIEFSCEDASRSNPEFLYRILEAAIEAGATTVNIPDTVGYAVPDEFGRLIAGIKANVLNIDKAIISTHCHNDLGMAVANTIAAIQNGARQVEVTMNGIGERAGNCALEEIAMILTTRKEHMGLTHGINTTRINRTSQMVSNLTGIKIPICKAIVGKNAFAHESGIHQHGMLSNPMTYEIMTPESVGIKESSLVLGKHSGRHAFVEHLKNLGYELQAGEVDDTFTKFKDLADRKKEITDEDLATLLDIKLANVPNVYELETFQIQSGNKMDAMASVTLKKEDITVNEAATGEGPIDAAYNAVMRIVNEGLKLAAYNISAVTGGEDALGEVTVSIEKNGNFYTGKGLAPDIIEASIRAFINAVNRYKSEAK